MRRIVLGLIFAMAAGAACAQSAPQKAPTVTLTPVVVQMNDGQDYGVIRRGILCEESRRLTWERESRDEPLDTYRAPFFSEMKRVGVQAEGDPGNLFESRARLSSDFEVAVAIKQVNASLCQRTGIIDDIARVGGKMSISAEWQLFSRLKNEVVAKVATSGDFELQKGVPDGAAQIFSAAFAENVRQFVESAAFKAAVQPGAGISGSAVTQTPIAFTPGAAGKRPIGDAVGSVVAVLAGGGHGSGFLVSSDGYVLTNHHVVGSATYVKIRWSDGFEALGEVIRSDARRDVALIKTDRHGRTPLALRTAGVEAGEAVYAIGTPLDQAFQSTVTRGVVSAKRLIDGFSYIQSDVTINPGNSGGPLLDEKGAVVGVAVSGYRDGAGSTGINMFIPIGDALDFLALKPTS